MNFHPSAGRGSILGTPVISSTPLRAAIRAHHRAGEADCVFKLMSRGRLLPTEGEQAARLATGLVEALRARRGAAPVVALMREYDLSSPEGIMLMCLAEALLRVPDTATADALIRDKIAGGDWRSHINQSTFAVNAASCALDLAARLIGGSERENAPGFFGRGRDVILREAMTLAIRRMGEIFVCGETITEALRRAPRFEQDGFRFSYDMLGEAALTQADADRYLRDYETAIAAIGQAAAGRGLYAGPGISIKLSALHPRYSLAQRERVLRELTPRLSALVALAMRHDIGISIDAEESERLDLSLDLLEALCQEPRFCGWNGIGFVVQAYQKRAPFVLDWVIDLARRTGHRLMLRLVKGAYWDSEIKRAQIEGLADYPVFTRKAHTDLSYLACARQLLQAPDAIFPQFATHNAQTLSAVHAMAGGAVGPDRLEFQCLHGMGEPLYREAFRQKIAPACRIYAPVGTHETLLAYLVRRLLENGANASFVNRVQDPAVAIADLIREPAAEIAADPAPGAPNPRIPLPPALYGPRRMNARGIDLADVVTLSDLDTRFQAAGAPCWRARPQDSAAVGEPLRNPADRDDVVGHVVWAGATEIETALARAVAAAPGWAATAPTARAACLDRAADRLEDEMPQLLPLLIREAGKTMRNAVAEVREAVDFLRYYAAEARETLADDTPPLGPVACISPWNFPLAIFLGQIAAALVAGNPVLAKPAEETPLIAAAAVALMQSAGLPAAVLQLLPGAGAVGAALVDDARVRGVAFTGSSAVAKSIQSQLARRLNPDGSPVPLIAETGGLNAMIVDSSALPEQVVADVLNSAFDSAGQRCSALRLLCVQQEIASRLLPMLEGAMAELAIGDPWHFATDIGSVISVEAQEGIERHVAAMQAGGFAVRRAALPSGLDRGFFVAPTILYIGSVADLTREVFGPVLHVLTFAPAELDRLVAEINATGFALTAGVHSRIDHVIERTTRAFAAGNIYVNRNIIGATVGVQPFGGHGLSGTGPKAGGPLYLRRFLSAGAALPADALRRPGPLAELVGPVGERNLYGLRPRGAILCVADSAEAGATQIRMVRDSGNIAILEACSAPPDGAGEAGIVTRPEAMAGDDYGAVLFSGCQERLLSLLVHLVARPGPIVPVFTPQADGHYPALAFGLEYAVSTNTAASGGSVELFTAPKRDDDSL